MTPDLRRLDAKIRQVLDMKWLGQQRNFLLGADSGMGKTTYTNYLLLCNIPEVLDSCNRVPVVKVDVPVNELAPKTLTQRLIQECGLAYADGDTEEQLLRKLRAYLRICGVQLMILDEVEPLEKHSIKRRLIQISNRNRDIPIICTSCNPLKWTADDIEVAGRWNDYFRIELYRKERLDSLLTLIELLLPLTGDSQLSSRSIESTDKKGNTITMEGPATIIEERTGGILKHIMGLISTAAKEAIETNQPALSPELLKRSWNKLQAQSLDEAKETPSSCTRKRKH